MTGAPDSDLGTGPGGGEKWSARSGSGKGCVKEGGIKDESKVLAKVGLPSAEMEKTARDQVEVSGAQFWTGCI